MTSDDKLLTPKQAAEYLGVKENTLAVWRSTKRYELPFIKIGRSIRYRVSDLENFIKN
jgi:excisionase family DNA binding protein